MIPHSEGARIQRSLRQITLISCLVVLLGLRVHMLLRTANKNSQRCMKMKVHRGGLV